MYTATHGDRPGKAFGAPAAGLRNLKIPGSAAVLLSHTGVIALPGLVNVEHILHATVTLPKNKIGVKSDKDIDRYVWETVLLQRGRKNATAVSTVARFDAPDTSIQEWFSRLHYAKDLSGHMVSSVAVVLGYYAVYTKMSELEQPGSSKTVDCSSTWWCRSCCRASPRHSGNTAGDGGWRCRTLISIKALTLYDAVKMASAAPSPSRSPSQTLRRCSR